MKQRVFGAAGVEVPVIGQGTWNVALAGAGRKAALRALRLGIELGMTHIDTAEMYGSGAVEDLVAEAIAGVDRARLFLASKVLPENASYRGTREAAHRSLTRLRTEYLDLYLLHWPGSHPLEETMRALESLVADGTARFVGVSNFDAPEMEEAASYLSGVPLVCNQVLYHLCERGVEHRLISQARRDNVAVVAYTPFGRGEFLRAAAGRAVLEGVARKHAATPRQIALAFLVREPNVFTIPKASSEAHVRENAGAADIALDDDDIGAIDAAFSRGRPRPLATL
ncbi:MAG TPA: aldo/keto reductase [Candidatus Cybelea sp.]|jgi:diketogulonate reductase-like aldo/keto reductase|nr:aldo/keto reductase [Candidatus Cybelea sp.]